MISGRQEKLLNFLIKEYICTAEPVSSKALKKTACLNVCGATIRNDLQVLTKEGYIEQPHTSAGRVPTKKAYKYFADKIADQQEQVFSDFIVRQIRSAHQQIEQEMRLAQELMNSLSQASSALTISSSSNLGKDDLFEILIRLGPSRVTYDKNIDIINKIIKEFENF